MLKRIVNIFLILIVGIPVMGQTEIKNKSYANRLKFLLSHNVEEISVKDAVAISDKVVFLDSREKSEYNISHIKDAQWVGYDDFDIKRLKTISKDSKIIIYCSVGYRSEKVTKKLEKAGFKKVFNMYGGLFEWYNVSNQNH